MTPGVWKAKMAFLPRRLRPFIYTFRHFVAKAAF